MVSLQHEELHRQFLQLQDALSVSDGESSLRLVTELAGDLEQHFRDEEELMLAIAYPDASGHRWHHEVLASDKQSIVAVITAGLTHQAVDLTEWLRRIVIDHMHESDAELMRFCELVVRRSLGEASSAHVNSLLRHAHPQRVWRRKRHRSILRYSRLDWNLRVCAANPLWQLVPLLTETSRSPR